MHSFITPALYKFAGKTGMSPREKNVCLLQEFRPFPIYKPDWLEQNFQAYAKQ